MDIPFSSSAQTFPSHLSHGLTPFLLASSLIASFQISLSIYRTFPVLVSLLPLLTLPLLLPRLISLISLLLSLLLLSSFFSASSFYLSLLSASSFCFSHPDFLCTSLHCLPHSSGYLVILTSPVFQSISGL